MLTGFWYLATPGARLQPGRTLPATLLDHAMLLGRRRDGSVFAVAEACPHRGMPLRHGTFDGDTLRCCFHGWAFRTTDGCCTEIPSAAPADNVEPSRFRLRTWPCREVQGNVWVFVGEGEPGAVPTVPGFEDAVPQVTTSMRFPCGVDLAASGFFDPAHLPFVHTSRWWKSNPAGPLRLKTKQFEPAGFGFRMLRHHLVKGANPYRLLGREVFIDISIALPGIRIENIEGERHQACVLVATTPISGNETEVHSCIYWTPRWLGALKPIASRLSRNFLGQDRQVAVRMADNPAPAPALYVGGADAQLRWYMRLKREYLEATAEHRPFANPLRPQTLQWRS